MEYKDLDEQDERKRYMCRRCNINRERYRAKDNVPRFAHLCHRCFWEMNPTRTECSHYVDLDTDQ